MKDFMIRDPFDKPREFESDGNSVWDHVYMSLVPDDKRKGGMLLTTPVSQARSVIDAKPTGVCCVCQEGVWVSPSSKEVAETLDVICSDCFGDGLRVYGDRATKPSPEVQEPQGEGPPRSQQS